MEKTYIPKPGEISQSWLLVDANDQNLGRLASRITSLLLGKHKPNFTPGVETGDYVTDIKKLCSATSWSPKVPLREGIGRTVAYYREHRHHYW